MCRASKLPDVPRYRLRHVGPSSSVLRPKLRNHPQMFWPKPSNMSCKAQPHNAKLWARQAFHLRRPDGLYLVLPHFLTWPPLMHRLQVHDFVLLFLDHADLTWSRRLSGPSNQAYLSLHHPKATLAKTFRVCSSPATTQIKPHVTSVIPCQESVCTILPITRHWEVTIHWFSDTPGPLSWAWYT
jgi:hypothetical protein